jgi:hypothetical protein
MVSKENKLMFLYPPKTASSSLKNCLVNSKIRFNHFGEYHQPNTHLFASELVDCFKIENIESYKIIQLFRDPFKRFVSGYYHFIPHLPNHYKAKSLNLNDFVSFYEECIISDDYIKCMYDDPEWPIRFIKDKIHFGFTRYFIPQLKWNDLSLNVRYFILEDISKDITVLSDYIGHELKELKFLNKNSNPSHKIELLNDNSIEIIGRLYKEDIQFFNTLTNNI